MFASPLADSGLASRTALFTTLAQPPPPAGVSSSRSHSPTLGLCRHEAFSCLGLRFPSPKFLVDTAAGQGTSV